MARFLLMYFEKGTVVRHSGHQIGITKFYSEILSTEAGCYICDRSLSEVTIYI